jgi:16S rRNA G966 N2-methylase RsmD
MRALDPPYSAPEAQRQSVAALLQHTYSWTRAASAVVPSVAQQVAPALTVAAQLYEAQQYGAAADQLSRVAWLLSQARQAYPGLPEL